MILTFKVNDHDLREATHEQAVQIIKSAKNPVKFVVQSLHSFPSYQVIVLSIHSSAFYQLKMYLTSNLISRIILTKRTMKVGEVSGGERL